MASADYNNSVFINCPFDKDYLPYLHAIVFTIYRCGFFPVCALAEDNAGDTRLDKIIRCIEKSKYSIHDISRVELSEGFPRFNMPFELGIFFGAKYFGNKIHKAKNALVFEKEKFTYQRYISDLSGIDTKAHGSEIDTIIRSVRDWLFTSSKRKMILRHPVVQSDYSFFVKDLSAFIMEAKLKMDELLFNDYCQIVEEFIDEKIQKP